MPTYTAELLTELLEKHGKWLRGELGGERLVLDAEADLRYADLRYADLRYADLRYANLSSADLRYADLRYANLSSADLRSADLRYADLRSADLRSAKTKINWQSHDVIAEILRRAAKKEVQKRMVAGLILVSRDWCWDKFLNIDNELREWALEELSKWVTDDDGAPDILTARVVTTAAQEPS